MIFADKDTEINALIVPFDTQVYYYSRNYKEDYFYINVNELTNSSIDIMFDDSETPIKTMTEPGSANFKLPDDVQWVFMIVTSFSTSAVEVKFRGVFFQTLTKPFTIDTIKAG
jgi:hypothetical protein